MAARTDHVAPASLETDDGAGAGDGDHAVGCLRVQVQDASGRVGAFAHCLEVRRRLGGAQQPTPRHVGVDRAVGGQLHCRDRLAGQGELLPALGAITAHHQPVFCCGADGIGIFRRDRQVDQLGRRVAGDRPALAAVAAGLDRAI